MKAVIQCGGQPMRAQPYTMGLPKALLPVRSQPVLELLLRWLRRNEVRDIYITTGYLGHLIKSFCGDGRQWDVRIRYIDEKAPLGTIGPLAMLREELVSTFLVINGDVITDLGINAFTRFHRHMSGSLTVASVLQQTHMEFGVIEEQNGRITNFREKPVLSNLVSMGVYCMEPTVLQHIPAGVPFGIDDLIRCLLGRGIAPHYYEHDGVWLDISRTEDFHSAQELTWDVQVPVIVQAGAA